MALCCSIKALRPFCKETYQQRSAAIYAKRSLPKAWTCQKGQPVILDKLAFFNAIMQGFHYKIAKQLIWLTFKPMQSFARISNV